MNGGGAQLLVGTIVGLLLLLAVTNGLTLAALAWSALALGTVLLVSERVMRLVAPHEPQARRLARVTARLVGVRLLGADGLEPPRIRGIIDDCFVLVDAVPGGFRLSVGPVHRDAFAEVQLSLQPSAGRPSSGARRHEGQDGHQAREIWRTGDPRFDTIVRIEGKPPEALLVLDAQTRRMVIDATRLGITLQRGRLRSQIHSLRSVHGITTHIECMVSLARRLLALESEEVRARARHIIENDPVSETRARALWTYQDHYALDPADRHCVERALDDRAPWVRLAAAGALIAVDPSDPAPGAALAEAVARGEHPGWVLEQAAARLLEHGRPEVIAAALQARLRTDGPLPIDILRWAVDQQALDATALGRRVTTAPAPDAEAAVAFFATAGAGMEPALAMLLEHPAPRVVLQTIDALASARTSSALRALTAFALGSPPSRQLRSAALAAAQSIRTATPTDGRLSLVDSVTPVGRLSVSERRSAS